jgi:flagellar assembly factor FliW
MTAPQPDDTTTVTTLRVQTGFGEFDVAPSDILTFPNGLPGFERSRRFVLLSSDEELAPFRCLQAVEGPPASFVVIDPRIVLPAYRTSLSHADLVRLTATEETPLVWLAIVTLGTAEVAPHVNLRAPIVINPETMVGYQLMPSNSLYPLRHPLGGA